MLGDLQHNFAFDPSLSATHNPVKSNIEKSTSTSIVNGRKVSKTTLVENGKKTVLTYENDVLVEKLINGISQPLK